MTFTWYCVHWRIWWENKEKNNCPRGITEKKKKATKENSAFLSPNKDQLDNYLCTKIAIGDCKIFLGSFINAIKQTDKTRIIAQEEKEDNFFLPSSSCPLIWHPSVSRRNCLVILPLTRKRKAALATRSLASQGTTERSCLGFCPNQTDKTEMF